MNLHALRDAPPEPLRRALADFEAQFTYPLGPGRSFRISHGYDYPRFFRAIGSAVSFVAERDGRVAGVVGVAIRPLVTPDGAQRPAAYVGDLKVSPAARGTLVFPRLARAALAWARPQVDAGYGVVMDGTTATPAAYTGRAAVPAFRPAGKVFVLRLPAVNESPAGGTNRWIDSPADAGPARYAALSHWRYAAAGGNPAERSEMTPVWLVHPDGSACGRLEDTRRAKRLWADDGTEMVSAHLACFAFATPRAGAELLEAAGRIAGGSGFPAVFVAVAEPDMTGLSPALGAADRVVAPATVYAAGLDAGPAWNINSSEI